jgi:hypothetical protein
VTEARELTRHELDGWIYRSTYARSEPTDQLYFHGDAGQHEGVGALVLELLEHPLLEGVEEDLLGAGVLRRRRAVDELAVLRRAEVELVQLVLVEGALAALDHRRRGDARLEHLLDRLHAVQPEVRLDAFGLEADERVDPAAEGEGGLEVVLLLEAGAGAELLPGVLPVALAVVAGAPDAAPVLLQALDADNLSAYMLLAHVHNIYMDYYI